MEVSRIEIVYFKPLLLDSSNVLVISTTVTAVILSIAVAAVVWILVFKQAKR